MQLSWAAWIDTLCRWGWDEVANAGLYTVCLLPRLGCDARKYAGSPDRCLPRALCSMC